MLRIRRIVVWKIFRLIRVTGLLSLLSVLSILSLEAVRVWGAEITPAEKEVYFNALADAEEATQAEISRMLLAVVPRHDKVNDQILHGGSIVWEYPDDPGNSRLKVVSFMSRAGYNFYYEPGIGEDECVLTKSIWVTVVPELKNFFFHKDCPPTNKRVAKALGLNPAYDYEILVELWVYPKDLFRPSPDPEITDHEAELAVMITEDDWVFPSDINPFQVIDNTVLIKDLAYQSYDPMPFKEWFVELAQTSYNRSGGDPEDWGYPWTRLGYTYDWGNADDHVGLSEFIIRIDPDKPVDPDDTDGYKGAAIVKLERAIDCLKPEWGRYFSCIPRYR